MREIRKIILHCTDSEIADQTVAMIDRWHRDRGWRGIGYHGLFHRDGTFEMGRPWEQVGAHCKGHNLDSLGFALAGRHRFTPEQIGALYAFLLALKRQYPKATLHGHNEFSAKSCPNFPVEPLRQFWSRI